jgi:hypothetical protein
LPFVDPDRIGFYGLSYGGKTAMRVPLFIEQPGENRRGVEPRKAEPVHRPRTADQRGGLAVRQEGVVRDGL